MVSNTRENSSRGKNMGKGSTNGRMVTCMMATFKWTKGKEWAFTYGLIKVYIKGNGERTG